VLPKDDDELGRRFKGILKLAKRRESWGAKLARPSITFGFFLAYFSFEVLDFQTVENVRVLVNS